jgi:hypothetical protein
MHARRECWGSEAIASLLNSALDGGEWLASCPGHFTRGESVQYQLGRKLEGPQIPYECFGKVENLLHMYFLFQTYIHNSQYKVKEATYFSCNKTYSWNITKEETKPANRCEISDLYNVTIQI